MRRQDFRLAVAMRLSDQRFLNALTPGDVGFVVIGNRVLRFEGFTDECWDDAIQSGKTIEMLEVEILNEWSTQHETKSRRLIEGGWWTEDIFYAIYSG